MITVNGRKMGKSYNNQIKLTEMFSGTHPLLTQPFSPMTIRFFILQSHYRSPIEYSEERLQETRRGLQGFHRFFDRFERITKSRFFDLPAPTSLAAADAGAPNSEFATEVAGLRTRFLEFMNDDFNTGGAIGIVYEMLTTLNRIADQRKLEEGGGKPEDCVSLCHPCHKLIDDTPDDYPGQLLQRFKTEQEGRVRLVMSLAPDMRTAVVQFKAPIHGQAVDIPVEQMVDHRP
jgi:cysteinyl-tRNA synthetase